MLEGARLPSGTQNQHLGHPLGWVKMITLGGYLRSGLISLSHLKIVIPELPLFCLLAGAAGVWLMGMRVETEVQRNLTFPQRTHESGSPVSFGSLLMRQNCPLGDGGRVDAAGKGGPRSKLTVCLSLSEKKHCLLELGARGVRELVHSEVYPIVIHVEVTEKNVREIR